MFHVLGWIVFGALAGFIAAKIVNARGEGCIVNAVLGILGAVVGGGIFRFLGAEGQYGFFWSLFVAVIGAIIVLLLWQAATGRRTLR